MRLISILAFAALVGLLVLVAPAFLERWNLQEMGIDLP